MLERIRGIFFLPLLDIAEGFDYKSFNSV